MRLFLATLATRTAAAVLAAAVASASASAAPRSAGRFELGTAPVVFDGQSLDVVVLQCGPVALHAFTFAAWTPDRGQDRYGLSLRHRKRSGVQAGISLLGAADVPADEKSWSDYVRAAREDLGPGAVAVSEADSRKQADVVHVLGWRTREVALATPALPGSPAREELHVVAMQGMTALAFVLAGDRDEVEAATQDFRFLLSRLSVPDRGGRGR